MQTKGEARQVLEPLNEEDGSNEYRNMDCGHAMAAATVE